MIDTVVKISVLRLWNSKQELMLIFLVPILFFSIFAWIFDRGVGKLPEKVRVSIIDDDPSELTRGAATAILQHEQIDGVTGVGTTDEKWPVDRLARAVMTRFAAEIVVYFPKGFSAAAMSQEPIPVQILNEGTNPLSAQIVEAGLAQSLTATIRKMELRQVRQPASSAGTGGVHLASATRVLAHTSAEPLVEAALPTFETHDVFASNKHQPKIALYAAGIAVMFLLFSASGAGASLLEEREAGTLDRLLSSRLTINQLLLGKWTYMVMLGLVQISTMFVWGQLVFSVDLWGHLPGFALMAVATSCATASFALFLAAVCRSRTQLNAVSLVVVLGMSALGGSMIPRYLMSDSMQRLGKFTFNGWALDGFKKIFWYDQPVSAIRTEVCVLLLIALILGLLSALLVRRWSAA